VQQQQTRENKMNDTKLKATLTTDCVCESASIDSNGEEVWTTGEDCFGCYDDSVEWLRVLVRTWAKENGLPSETVRIEGTGLGWQKLSGYKVVDISEIENLDLSGEYRIEFTLDGKELTAQRWSHDEPMGGARFTFAFVDDSERD
jgi:hypothetical protein